MKMKMAVNLIAAANFVLCGAAFAAGAKTYEVTGTVLETTPTKIIVEKGRAMGNRSRSANQSDRGSDRGRQSNHYVCHERDQS